MDPVSSNHQLRPLSLDEVKTLQKGAYRRYNVNRLLRAYESQGKDKSKYRNCVIEFDKANNEIKVTGIKGKTTEFTVKLSKIKDKDKKHVSLLGRAIYHLRDKTKYKDRLSKIKVSEEIITPAATKKQTPFQSNSKKTSSESASKTTSSKPKAEVSNASSSYESSSSVKKARLEKEKAERLGAIRQEVYDLIVEGDYENAFKVANKGAEEGSLDCQYILGYLYGNGLGGVPKNEEKALEYLEPVVGKISGAGYAMGLIYYKRGEFKRALSLSNQDAALGDPLAKLLSARVELETFADHPKNIENAQNLLKEIDLSTAGFSPDSLQLYYETLCDVSSALAARGINKAAVEGFKKVIAAKGTCGFATYAKAVNNMGVLYAKGVGLPKDLVSAAFCFALVGDLDAIKDEKLLYGPAIYNLFSISDGARNSEAATHPMVTSLSDLQKARIIE